MDALSETSLKNELARQLGDMELAAKLTTVAMKENAAYHRHAAGQVAATLNGAQTKLNVAKANGSLTGEKQQQVMDLTRHYMADMLYLTHKGSVQITHLLMEYAQQRR